MQLHDDAACGLHEQEGQYRVNQTGDAGREQAHRKVRCVDQVFNIAFADGCRMPGKQCAYSHTMQGSAVAELRGCECLLS